MSNPEPTQDMPVKPLIPDEAGEYAAVNQTIAESMGDFQADAHFDYIPIGAALSKYSSLLETLTYNREHLTLEQIEAVLVQAHTAMMKKLARAQLHIEQTGTTPRLPR